MSIKGLHKILDDTELKGWNIAENVNGNECFCENIFIKLSNIEI